MDLEISQTGTDTKPSPGFPVQRKKVNPEVQDFQSQKPTKSVAIKRKWNNYVGHSTLHGLHYVFTSPTLLKRSLWAIFLLGGFVLFIYQSTTLLTRYFSYPVTTKATLIYEKTPEFPAVSICNFNMLRKSQIERYNFQEYVNYGLRDKLRYVGIEVNESKIDWSRAEKTNMSLVYRLGGHLMSEMLLECHWSGTKCSHRDFKVVMTSMGLCYTFNSGNDGRPILRVENAGVNYGLHLTLDVQQDDYYGLFGRLAGLKVLIHHHETPPIVDQLGFSLSPGSSTFAAIQKQMVKNLPKPYESNCSDDTIANIPGYTKYTTSACLLTCQTRYIVEKCGCRDVRMQAADNAEFCSVRQTATCLFQATTNFHKLGGERCDCPVPCEIVTYKPLLSYAAFPSNNFLRDLFRVRSPGGMNNGTEDEIRAFQKKARENFLELHVYFQELNIFYLEQQAAYDVASLLGEIGGQVGLCLGASLLTLLEFGDVLCAVVAIRLGFRR